MIGAFIFAVVFHGLAFYMSYGKPVKDVMAFYTLGAVLGALSTIAWYYIARHTPDASKLLVYGIYWDVMVACIWIGGPLLFFGAKLTGFQWLGLAMIIGGLGLTKFLNNYVNKAKKLLRVEEDRNVEW
jgi:drug/metabolite transporter (DMT)-like permease